MNGMSTMYRNGMYAETGCANTAALFRSISLGLAPDAGINGPKMMPEEVAWGKRGALCNRTTKRSQLACHPHAETHTDKPLWPSEPIFPVNKA